VIVKDEGEEKAGAEEVFDAECVDCRVMCRSVVVLISVDSMRKRRLTGIDIS
jgi:hypothetical protein